MKLLRGTRNARNFLLFSIAAVSIYIPLKILFINMPNSRGQDSHLLMRGSRNQVPFSPFLNPAQPHEPESQRQLEQMNDSKSNIRVAIKNVYPRENGKVDLVLSLDMNELMKMWDKGTGNSAEATSNPVPNNVSWVLHSPDFCERESGLKYLVYVHSSPLNNARRYNLRTTWAQNNLFKDHRTKLLFVMGLPDEPTDENEIKEEMIKFGDILQGDFVDNYQNLTYKGLLALKWISTYCQNALYAIKADDDAFINIFKITAILESNLHRKRLVVCPQWKTMPILRDPSKCMKWCVKYTEFPGKNYFPRYCAGLSYALSKDIIPLMYQASTTTPFFWIDDVYITGLLTAKVPGTEVIDMLSYFCLKEDLALEHFSDLNRPLSDHYVHIKRPENFHKLWKLLLMRLGQQELHEISDEIAEENPYLKAKLSK